MVDAGAALDEVLEGAADEEEDDDEEDEDVAPAKQLASPLSPT